MKFQREHQSSAWSPKNSTPEQTSQLTSQPFAIQPQQESGMSLTQPQIENQAFEQQKFEATGLEIKHKDGSITPQEQKRLGVLQAQMDGLLTQRVEQASRFGHNFANVAVLPSNESVGVPIQAKLTIGQPGDKYEQEADAMASQVVSQINQPQSHTLQREEISEEENKLQMQPQMSTIQRQDLPGEEDNKLQMQPELGIVQREPMVNEEDDVQRQSLVQRLFERDGMAATPDLEASIQQAKGSGQSLTDSVREPMEQSLGADLSRVKIHTDAQSDQLNQSIQAKVFTTGTDIFFRQGAYDPESRGGQELIAHELTHVVQQNGSRIQRKAENPAGTVDVSAAPSEIIQCVFDLNEDDGRALQRSTIPNTLKKILESDFWTRLLRDFAASEFTSENIDFLLRVKVFQQNPSKTEARRMYSDFIDVQSPTQLNLTSAIVNTITSALQSASVIGQAPQAPGAWKSAIPLDILQDVFNQAEQHIYGLVELDTFKRFRKRITEIKEERKQSLDQQRQQLRSQK